MFAATPSHTGSFACNFSTQDVCWVQKPVVSRPTGAQRNRGPRSKQNVFQCAVWLFPHPRLRLILCGQFSRRGKRAVSVSSQGLIIAADVGSSHSSLLWLLVPSFSAATLRTVLLRSAVAADLVFHPDHHFCGFLWTVSVHIARSLFPAAALVPFTLSYLHLNCFRHTILNVEALQSLEAPVRETTTWTFFVDLFWKICFVL